MHEHFVSEVWRLIIALLIATLLGSVTGAWGLSLFIGMSVLFGWHLYQIYLLETWLRTNNENAFEQLCGIWLYTADAILSTKRQSKKRKKRLSQLIQRFHQTLEAMPDAAVVLDNDAHIEWTNSAARKYLNISHRDTVKGIKEFLKDPAFSDYLASGEFDEPIVMVSPVDPSLELEVKMTSFGRGQLLLTAHDVSEGRKLQAVRRDFIANVSHELRTPLTVVSGYMEMLQQEALDEPVQEAIRASNRQAERMQSIVSDLLMLSRLEMEDELPLSEAHPVDVAAFLANLVTDAETLSGDKRHKLTLNADDRLGLLGSENELASAFGNLIFNAVRHTPSGTAINIFWGREGQNIRLVVDDKGPGIPPEHLSRLTERFYRVDKGRSRESGGTGLGLSIVKHVLKRHDGVIEIETVPEQGSRFICIFPVERQVKL